MRRESVSNPEILNPEILKSTEHHDSWQRRLRLMFALGAVALASSWRSPSSAAPVSATTPSAARIRRRSSRPSISTRPGINRDKEEVRIQAGVMRAYGDGTAKGEKLTVTTVRSGGRTFILKSDRAEVGKNESSYTLEGNVRLTASDGLSVQTERATYLEAEGIIRAAGPVTFSRGRMSGSGIGFSYDKNQDRLRILKDVSVQIRGRRQRRRRAGADDADEQHHGGRSRRGRRPVRARLQDDARRRADRSGKRVGASDRPRRIGCGRSSCAAGRRSPRLLPVPAAFSR